ncbi:unnamed protein product [Dovyalis caffra]|uniref:DUF1664 domain-containing protein n=1 Tax=Dovyalis caffra TaxID=77055 RepID=A0AAV1RHE6_9ROSI|nr:unnamed protein product [Dovyalis caffra]
MALPLGKLTILVGAGILGSVLAKEGHLPDVSSFVSGAFKIALRQLKRDDSTSSVSKSSKPPNDSLMAQVTSLRQELQMLASSRPVTIVTASGTGSNKYGVVVVVVVVGYGYVWWKGWKLPDMMFATRRSLSDACTSIAQQLESVYGSIRSTRRHLSSKIDGVDSNLNAVAELTASTQERVTELREDSGRIGSDVRYVRDAVETLDLTTQGVKRLCDYASGLENNLLEENTSASSSRLAFSSKVGALPAPSSEPSTPSASNGSLEVQSSPRNAASASSQQRSNGISGVAEVGSSLGISNGIRTSEETTNGTSWFKSAFLMRTFSATNSVASPDAISKRKMVHYPAYLVTSCWLPKFVFKISGQKMRVTRMMAYKRHGDGRAVNNEADKVETEAIF